MSAFTGVTPILNVKNLNAATDYYVNRLGFRKKWEWGEAATFGAVERGAAVLFLCQGAQGPPGVWLTVWVDDVDALHQEYLASGAIIREAPMNFPWENREMLVQDLDGHYLRMTGPATGPPDEGCYRTARSGPAGS